MSSQRSQSLIAASITQSTDSTENLTNHIALICQNLWGSWDTKHIRETWSQLLSAHHDLVFDSSLLFTLHNMFDASSYLFSVTVQLTDLSSISDALIDCLLNKPHHYISSVWSVSGNDTVRNAYLCNWTITAKQAIKTQWRKVKRIERSVFSKSSSFIVEIRNWNPSFWQFFFETTREWNQHYNKSKGERSVDHFMMIMNEPARTQQ
jgi:hypothetical protein